MNGYAENAKPCSRCHKKPKWLRDPFGEYHHLGCECGRVANAGSWDGATVNNWDELFGEKGGGEKMDNRSTDLAELLDLVRGSSPQLDVPRVLTGLLQCMEAHGEKLHSMFSKWHELDMETNAQMSKVAASTDGLDGLVDRLAALEEGLKKLKNAPQQPHVDDVTRQAVKNLLATVDKLVDALRVVNQDSTSRFEGLDARVKTVEKTGVDVIQDLFRLAERLDKAENGLRVVDQGTALRLEALEASLKKLENGLQVVDQGAGYRLRVEEGLKKLEALEKAVGGPVMERFLGLDGKGQPLTERMETAFQQAVEMDRLKKVEKDLEKLLAEAQARNQALQARLDGLTACVYCNVPAADHCAGPCSSKSDRDRCCGEYRAQRAAVAGARIP